MQFKSVTIALAVAAAMISASAQAEVTKFQELQLDGAGAPKSAVFSGAGEKLVVSNCSISVDGVDAIKNDYTFYYPFQEIKTLQVSDKSVTVSNAKDTSKVEFKDKALAHQFVSSVKKQSTHCKVPVQISKG